MKADAQEIVVGQVPFVSQDDGVTEQFVNLCQSQFWADRSCGIACLRMVIGHFRGILLSCRVVFAAANARDAYVPGKGWSHVGLAGAAHGFGIGATAIRAMDSNDLAKALCSGSLAIVSVTPGLLGGTIDTKTGVLLPPGGHLVVVFGIRTSHIGLSDVLVHDPDNFSQFQRRGEWVMAARFLASWSGNGIICTYTEATRHTARSQK